MFSRCRSGTAGPVLIRGRLSEMATAMDPAAEDIRPPSDEIALSTRLEGGRPLPAGRQADRRERRCGCGFPAPFIGWSPFVLALAAVSMLGSPVLEDRNT